MGQIVIDIPNRLKRHYQVSKELASKLMEVLDSSAVRVDSPDNEDNEDLRSARKARKEESMDWEEAKSLLGV
jgi:hypothetical protein